MAAALPLAVRSARRAAPALGWLLRRPLTGSVFDGRALGAEGGVLWSHLFRHAEFYARHQDADAWELALAIGPPTPSAASFQGRGLGVMSRVLRADGDAASGGGKLLLELPSNRLVETAIIMAGTERKKHRPVAATICVSSQAGCAMACKFCDTGLLGSGSERGGFNLPSWAILEQVLHAEAWVQRETGVREAREASNVVFMGMGEPLLNYSNVLEATRVLCAAGRKVTVSTVGVAPRIESLGKDAPSGLRLALSLHAPTQELRQELLPVAARAWSLEQLLAAVRSFETATGSGVLIEYILIRGLNDEQHHADALAQLIAHEGLRCAGVNLIPYNSTSAGSSQGYEQPSDTCCKQFRDRLRRAGAPNPTVRFSTKLGRDMAAACGQLGLRSAR